jgi:hypothetical protein
MTISEYAAPREILRASWQREKPRGNANGYKEFLRRGIFPGEK